ncbi:hypothetical protein CLV63_12465 [Murinocardiopsis flavida]|uniref:DNA-directed RNA polymerase specialized sigma24 family protein n=1 Tax=Murinocardiopsis flavida TaxID=645275 RepID=A0A2P8CYA3_9ACTN|nr:hypothetical protein [Murinocardiopsis flavida]PSK89961.1 hypothetical protein CLV63_12465 [Murinocardiopsis flavida]
MANFADSPFAVLRRSYRLLICGPTPPMLDLSELGGPARSCSAAELDRHLLSAPREVADAVWRVLLRRAREDDATWTVVAAGLALPGLYGARRWLRTGLGEGVDDLEAEMLTALVEEMRRTDLSRSGVCGRLVYAARKAGQRHRYTVLRAWDRERPWERERAEPSHAGHGAVTLLARALGTGALRPLEAELIARTHLEHAPLRQVAAELGLSYITARRYRRRAQERLAAVCTEEQSAV